MKILWCALSACLLLGSVPLARGAENDGLQSWEVNVDGATRMALVHVPMGAAPKEGYPVVFAFHGHGGNSQAAATKFDLLRLWPEAISVYPQGVNTPGARTDPSGDRPGWQRMPGEFGDRDLHLFDALLARVKKEHPVDARRVYATGHSNGGGFVYLLWFTRPKVFAAFAPCSGMSRYGDELTPKPALVSAGREDDIVSFPRQMQVMATLRRVNGCDATGKSMDRGVTEYPSKNGATLTTFIYSGGHQLDPAEPALIAKFFKQHPAASSDGSGR